VLNIICGILLVISGVLKIMAIALSPIIVGLYMAVFGIFIVICEFQMPSWIPINCGFLTNLLGRGLFYIFCGCLVLDNAGFNLFSGIFIIVLGVFYVAFHLTGMTSKISPAST
jgi:uncharacterized membrane protein HdeD (DUF308 family)